MVLDGMPDTTWRTHCDMINVSRITGLDWTVILYGVLVSASGRSSGSASSQAP